MYSLSIEKKKNEIGKDEKHGKYQKCTGHGRRLDG